MTAAEVIERLAAELALFAAAGFLLFALDDLLVDVIYSGRRAWGAATVYRRFPRCDAASLPAPERPGWMVVMVPAWDEAAVIGRMLRATLDRIEHVDYAVLVGHYRNDPATAAAIAAVRDPRVIAVEVDADGPTTKADCLNRLYAALVRMENAQGRRAKAIVLHDAEDVVHPRELALFDRLTERAGVVQLRWCRWSTRRTRGLPAIIATNLPKATARTWWFARRWALRSRSRGSAAQLAARRFHGWRPRAAGRPFPRAA